MFLLKHNIPNLLYWQSILLGGLSDLIHWHLEFLVRASQKCLLAFEVKPLSFLWFFNSLLQVQDVIEHFVVHIGMLKGLLEVTFTLCAIMRLLNRYMLLFENALILPPCLLIADKFPNVPLFSLSSLHMVFINGRVMLHISVNMLCYQQPKCQ